MQTVTVTTAVTLSAAQTKKITAALDKKLGKDSYELKTEIKPAIIGGIQIRIGSRLLDGSVATKIATVQQSLLNM